MNKLQKALLFTDIHFGKKNNSELHNADCIKFVQYVCDYVRGNTDIDHIIILGDWHEQRSSISGLTLKYSYEASKKLNELNIPIFVITGNHDLFYRNKRDIQTALFFEAFNNFTVITDSPRIIECTEEKILICPFLFEDEYADLIKYNNIKVWFGHFEFKGFVLTGESYIKEHGPDPETFKGPTRIFSGHYHKRQNKNNVYYIGNTFPMDFGDVNDNDRGFATYEYKTDNLEYHDWHDGPSYIKCNLSELVKKHKTILRNNATVRCYDDLSITQDEYAELREKFTTKYNLREFTIEEKLEEVKIDDFHLEDVNLEDTAILIPQLLNKIQSDKINNQKIIDIFKGLPND